MSGAGVPLAISEADCVAWAPQTFGDDLADEVETQRCTVGDFAALGAATADATGGLLWFDEC